jgi:hypothetical protein
VATVPDKRNTSKQRRAARNRASRDTLAARRENAVPTTSTAAPRAAKAAPSGGSTSRTSTKGAARGGTTRGARPARPLPVAVGPPPHGFKEMLQSRRPGDRSLLVAFGLAILSALFSLLVVRVDVDDRGEPLPFSYRALTLLARQAAGHDATVRSESMISAYGPIIILLVLTPVLITGYALWVNRRVDRARVLTFVLIALAVATMLSGGGTSLLQSIFSFGALIALGVGVFRIRKADMEAGMAAAPAAGGGVIDAEATEAGDVAPKSLLQRLLGPGAAGGGARGAQSTAEADVADDADDDVLEVDVVDGDADTAPAPEDGAPDDDPLAQLEAELAAEADDDAGPPTDAADDDSSSGNGRGRRRG